MSISVVIPTHNRHGDLREALGSVFAQSRLPEEIILVDDGSYPPVSREIFKNCPAGIDTGLFRNSRTLGANHARNTGIKQASGQWIAFLDDDDRYEPEKLKSLAWATEQDPDADLIYHPAQIRMVKEDVTYLSKPCAVDARTDVFRALLIKNIIGGSSMVAARRDFLIRAGLFDAQLPALQDYELWLRMAKTGCRCRFVHRALTVYPCITGKSSTSKSIAANRRALEIIEDRYKKDYAALTPEELKQHAAWKKRMIIHKALLNGKAGTALKEQLKLFVKSPRSEHLLGALAISMGAKTVYRIRAWKNPEPSR